MTPMLLALRAAVLVLCIGLIAMAAVLIIAGGYSIVAFVLAGVAASLSFANTAFGIVFKLASN